MPVQPYVSSSNVPLPNGPPLDRGLHPIYDERTGTWLLLDVVGNVQWRGFGPLPVSPFLRPNPLDTPASYPMPSFALAAQTAEASADVSSSSVQVPDAHSRYHIEVLEQTIYDRGLSSDYRLPDIAFQAFKLRDALNDDFRSLAESESAAWPESFQIPQKLAIVLCFRGYDKHSRQVNVLRHVQARTLPPTRSKLAHIVATVMDKFLAGTRDPSKHPMGPLSHRGRQLTVDDLVLIDVQHASKGSLQPTIGVIIGHA
ncbi:hypothetical protein K466DRAFT_32468 [Polyporus arcularius HHB13444]|uniref:Uncharacterized protein n=1 Tax=Polyporus arcularius HHB13444 TaxID=1314778 RepID=A0A5C3PT36_9APHY|nr:hypothetical protein K466DRAFT_32468 [Polyporus arcularius HHB13444]